MATRSRIGWSLVAGCCAGIPAGILLSYLAVLPLYLGLFFFLLFGLLIGAIMFRFGRSDTPPRPGTLLVVGAAVVLLTWTTTLATEYLTFPGLAAERVARSWRFPKPAEKAEIDRQTRHYVMCRLLEREYRPGIADQALGFPRYLKWIASDGTMTCPRVLDSSQLKLVMGQRGRSWAFRVLLSVGLLAFAILSQYMLLARPATPEPSDGNSPPEDR